MPLPFTSLKESTQNYTVSQQPSHFAIPGSFKSSCSWHWGKNDIKLTEDLKNMEKERGFIIHFTCCSARNGLQELSHCGAASPHKKCNPKEPLECGSFTPSHIECFWYTMPYWKLMGTIQSCCNAFSIHEIPK